MRDSGYSAEKIVGPTNHQSLDKELSNSLKKIFPKNKSFSQQEIIHSIQDFRMNLSKFFHRTPEYSNVDSRVWTILVDGGNTSVYLTLFQNSKDRDELHDDFGSDYIEINDGNQFVKPFRKKIITLSFEIIAEELNNLGILGK